LAVGLDHLLRHVGIAVVVVAIVNGVVKKWIHHRGFGFIATETGDDIFCHVTALKTGTYSLAVGDSVTFDVVDSDRKPGSKMAKEGRVIGPSPTLCLRLSLTHSVSALDSVKKLWMQ
jgi:CspA family cold shock protein